MLISRKRHKHMKDTIYRQADTIKVLALQREKTEHELTMRTITEEQLRIEIDELKVRLAAAEGRNEALRKATEGMQKHMRDAINEAAELRASNAQLGVNAIGAGV